MQAICDLRGSNILGENWKDCQQRSGELKCFPVLAPLFHLFLSKTRPSHLDENHLFEMKLNLA